ncbi:Ribonuclease H [Giardia lamblia P15]|uniref:ribonuclease H n=1 Tax=Giardia intestinalis (strain P15) TaxID=658858 RepID=E1EWP4_GIAIA|nr:Ribonuclease H [Giardia lamblia P15]
MDPVIKSVYATHSSSNVIYIGYPWSYVKRFTSGVSGLTVKKFRTPDEPFSSGWYKDIDPKHVKIKVKDKSIEIPKGSSRDKKPNISVSKRKGKAVTLRNTMHLLTKPTALASTAMFYGKSVADLAEMAKALVPDTCFKFLEESTNGSTRDYLTCYTEAKLHMEATERIRKENLTLAKSAARTEINNSGTPDYVAFTDGGSSPSAGGPGGWGCLLFNATEMHVFARSYKSTTNNRMELRGILCALLNVPEGSVLHIYSDSQYAINCCRVWITQWKKKGLLCPKNPSREAIINTTPLNKDLLLWIYTALQSRTVEFVHVKGHSGNELNDFVDSLCHLGRRNKAPTYDDVY